MLSPEIREGLAKAYVEASAPTIDPKTAKAYGQALLAAGYRMKSGLALELVAGTPTVRAMLREFPKAVWFSKMGDAEIIDQDGGIIGPYYMQDNDSEFCPEGSIGIWYPTDSRI